MEEKEGEDEEEEEDGGGGGTGRGVLGTNKNQGKYRDTAVPPIQTTSARSNNQATAQPHTVEQDKEDKTRTKDEQWTTRGGNVEAA